MTSSSNKPRNLDDVQRSLEEMRKRHIEYECWVKEARQETQRKLKNLRESIDRLNRL